MFLILTAPEFLVSIFSILVLIVARFVPGFTLEVPTLVGYVLVVTALLYKVFSDPDLSPIGRWARLLKTPEFIVALISIVLMVLSGFGITFNLGITIDQIAGAIVILATLIFGKAYQTRQIRLQAMRRLEAGVVNQKPVVKKP